MTDRPNILVVMADQFRAMACGKGRTDPTITPNIDRLAREGTDVQHAVSSYPVCSPHRAMFLTGAPPHVNGVTHNLNSDTAARGVRLRDLPTWASVLRERGFRTGYIGKWHLEGPTPEDERHGEGRRDDGKVWDAYSPPSRRFGFDFWHSYGAADQHLSPHYWVGDSAREERLDVDAWSAEHETDVAIERIAAWSRDERPFALMLSLNPPHQPFDAVPERYRRLVDDHRPDMLLTRANVDPADAQAHAASGIAGDYFAAVAGIDDQIGRLLDALDTMDAASDTIVLFTSDHGMQLGSHGLLYKNVPYEESMRIPLVVRRPGDVPAADVPEVLASVDLAPTILGLAGESEAIPPSMHGADRSQTLRGAPPTQDPAAQDSAALYYRYPSPDDRSDVRGIRTRSAKFVASVTPDGTLSVRAFDLRADPYELTDASSHAWARPLAERMLEELARDSDPWSGAGPLRRWLAQRLSERV